MRKTKMDNMLNSLLDTALEHLSGPNPGADQPDLIFLNAYYDALVEHAGNHLTPVLEDAAMSLSLNLDVDCNVEENAETIRHFGRRMGEMAGKLISTLNVSDAVLKRLLRDMNFKYVLEG